VIKEAAADERPVSSRGEWRFWPITCHPPRIVEWRLDPRHLPVKALAAERLFRVVKSQPTIKEAVIREWPLSSKRQRQARPTSSSSQHAMWTTSPYPIQPIYPVAAEVLAGPTTSAPTASVLLESVRKATRCGQGRPTRKKGRSDLAFYFLSSRWTLRRRLPPFSKGE